MRRIIARGMSLGKFPVDLNSMVKVVLAMALITISSAANAVTVILLVHNQTSGSGAISSLITDGAHALGVASTAVWDWDGTTLTTSNAGGIYSATGSLGSSPYSPSILNDHIIDLSINTGTGTANATSYSCNEGTFLSGVGANGCGDYTLGVNFVDESTTVWTGLTAAQTIGGDDVAGTGGPRLISAYDFDTFALISGVDGLTDGDVFSIGNGIPVGVAGLGGEAMQFQVVIPPAVAVDDPASGLANVLINIDVLANDTVADDISDLTWTVPTNGAVVLNGSLPNQQANLTLDYTSGIGFSGDATFDYTVTDGNGSSDTATVTVTVSNLLPIAADDIANVDGDGVAPVATDINVMSNDTLGDTAPNTHSVTVTANPANGTIGVITGCDAIATCVVPYTPNTGYFGPDSFTYQLEDGNGDTDTAIVTVNVVSASVPIATDDDITTDTAVPFGFNPLTNDAGLATVPLGIVFTQGANGVVTETATCDSQAACELTYTPNTGPDFAGIDSFTYTITDAATNSSTATVNVFVNDIPVANDDLAVDLPIAITAMPTDLDVQANDTGLNDAPITVTVVAPPANGVTAINAGVITYTSNAGFNGTDTFDYELLDSVGNPNPDTSNVATVTVDVNDQPVANDNGMLGAPEFMVPEGTTVSLDVLANDTGLSDVDLTVTILTNGTLGTATPTAPGDASTVRIDYTAGMTIGVDFIEYLITDNSGDTSSAFAFIAVTDVDFPMAFDDTGLTILDEPVSINVLANDTGLADIPLMVTITSDPANGVLGAITGCDQQGAACQVPYTPNAGFIGTDTFQYMVTDSTPDSSNIATVTVTVSDLPVAVNDAATGGVDQVVSVNVLANDSGLSDEPLTVTITSNPVNGSLGTITGCDQQVTCQVPYTPNAGFVGIDTYQYMVTDSTLDDSNIATVRITINDLPRAVFDESATFVGATIDINVLANDTGLGDAPLIIKITTDPLHGVVGQITGCSQQGGPCEVPYTPDADFDGSDSFQYQIIDSTPDESNVATVVVTVNKAPIANDDAASTTVSKSVKIDVLANDTGLDITPLTVTVTGSPHPQKGTAVPDGTSIVYTSIGDEATTDTFKYTVTDNNGNSAEASVTVVIDLEETSSRYKPSSSAVGPVGLGLLMLLPWLRRRYRSS